MEKFGVSEDATTEECFAETGRAPVGTKWVDVRGDGRESEHTLQIGGQGFQTEGREGSG